MDQKSGLKKLNKLTLIFLLFIFISCSGVDKTFEEKVHTTNEKLFADEYFQRGKGHFRMGNYSNALLAFGTSYQYYSLIDFVGGKIASSLELAKCYNQLGSADSVELQIKKGEILDKLTGGQNRYKILLTKSEILFAQNNYTGVIELLKGQNFLNAPNNIQIQLYSYQILSEIQIGKTSTHLNDLSHLLKDFDEEEPLSVHDPDAYSFGFYALGYTGFKSNNYAIARTNLTNSLIIDKALPNYPGIADNLAILGKIESATGCHSISAAHYLRTSEIYSMLFEDEKAAKMKFRYIQESVASGAEKSSFMLELENLLKFSSDDGLKKQIEEFTRGIK